MKHSKAYTRAANLLVHSVYPPSIIYWMQVLGSHRVLVVPAEALKTSTKRRGQVRLQAVLQRIYRFLGLCPFAPVPPQDVHTTHQTIDPQHRLNDTMRARLNDFYSPFNALLSSLTREDFGYHCGNYSLLWGVIRGLLWRECRSVAYFNWGYERAASNCKVESSVVSQVVQVVVWLYGVWVFGGSLMILFFT